MILNDKMYNVLKWLAKTVLPIAVVVATIVLNSEADLATIVAPSVMAILIPVANIITKVSKDNWQETVNSAVGKHSKEATAPEAQRPGGE